MKIRNVNKNLNFGLKIVDNDNYNRIYSLQLRKGKSYNEICNTFEKISKFQDDSVFLEFLDYEEKKTEIFGNAAYCNLRIFGTMKKSGSGEMCKIDKTTTCKDVVSSEYYLVNTVKHLINSEQRRIDLEDKK